MRNGLQGAEARYGELRLRFWTLPGMDQIVPTLEEALRRSRTHFETWRYTHERTEPTTANYSEMHCAFEALEFSLPQTA